MVPEPGSRENNAEKMGLAQGPLHTTPPLQSAADIPDRYRPLVVFDNWQENFIASEASDRAPTSESTYTHKVGLTGEYAVGAYFSKRINREIYPDYVGDNGYDLEVDKSKIEVKTTQKDRELRVQEGKVQYADYFVLAELLSPRMVQLLGWASQSQVVNRGESFPSSDILHLEMEQLLPLYGSRITSEEVATTQSRTDA